MKSIRFTHTLRAVILTILAITLAVSLTACKAKEPVTAGTFHEKMSGLGYGATDITDQYASTGSVTTCVGFESGSLHVEFFEIDGRDNAASFFNSTRAQVETYKNGIVSESSVNMPSYQRYTLKTSEKYYVVEAVGATALYAYSSRDDADLLGDVLKAIGY